MGGACSSATAYKSTASPVVSTLAELLSKQWISVLAPDFPVFNNRGLSRI